MRTVYKYDVPVGSGMTTLMIPRGYKILSVQNQYNSNVALIQIWAEVESEEAPQPVVVDVIGTGHPVPENSDYLGTCVVAEGSLVWHAYARRGQ